MYQSQIDLYSEALEITKNIKVKEKYLYLLGKDIAVVM
jgi:ATP-dependent exoDNAse (exonuclease V) beta subunit